MSDNKHQGLINRLRRENGELTSALKILKTDYERQIKANARMREKLKLIERVATI